MSGADGSRFVVIPSTVRLGSANPAWQPFDTASKRLAGYPSRTYAGACADADRLNEADRAEERATACS